MGTFLCLSLAEVNEGNQWAPVGIDNTTIYKRKFKSHSHRLTTTTETEYISLLILDNFLLSISLPTARTRKGMLQPFISHQITSTRPLPRSQSQAGFKEFHNPWDILSWNVSARGELALKGFLRYHPCKYSYKNKLDCIDSFKEVTCTVLIKELFFYTALIDRPFFSQLGLEQFDPIPCQSHKPTD